MGCLMGHLNGCTSDVDHCVVQMGDNLINNYSKKRETLLHCYKRCIFLLMYIFCLNKIMKS